MSMLPYEPDELSPSQADQLILEQRERIAELERQLQALEIGCEHARRLQDQVVDLRRQIERMKPVVEAAVRWAHDRVTQTDDYYANEALDAVVREYQKEE